MNEKTPPEESNVSDVTRRKFLKDSAQGATAIALGAHLIAQTSDAQATGIPTRPLGTTGERVSIIGLGGWHIGAVPDQSEAIKIMHTAIDEGLTFFDSAWDYHDGGSEEIIGKGLAQGNKRDQVFLMTKNCNRDYEGSKRCLEDSLRRFQTDHLDLWQFHEMNYDNDPDWVFDKGASKQPSRHRKRARSAISGLPATKTRASNYRCSINRMIGIRCRCPSTSWTPTTAATKKNLLPACLEQGVGAIGMKSLGGGAIPRNTDLTAADCLRYSLSQPISTLVCGIISLKNLNQSITAARTFKPMSEPELREMEESIKDVAGDGRYEMFKSTQLMDSLYHVKQHGFAKDSHRTDTRTNKA